MAAVKDAKIVGAPFSNAVEVVKVKFDSAIDGLAQADLDLLTAEDDVILKLVGFKVTAAVTSGGSAVFDLGVGVGGVQMASNLAITGFTLGAFVAAPVESYIKLAAGQKLVLGIEVANLTAGAFEVVLHKMAF